MKTKKNITEEQRMTLERLQKIGYERFKLQWMIEHGHTIAELLALCREYVEEVEPDSDGEQDVHDFIEEAGFSGGEIWPCFEEFLDHEFKNVSLMYRLLTPDDCRTYLDLIRQVYGGRNG